MFKIKSPNTKIIGVEPEGAPSLKTSLAAGENIELKEIEKFVDGAAVKKMGDINFDICKEGIDDVLVIPEGKICTALLKMYNEKALTDFDKKELVAFSAALPLAAMNYAGIEDRICKNFVMLLKEKPPGN